MGRGNTRVGMIKKVTPGDFGKVWRFLNSFCEDNNKLPNSIELRTAFPTMDEEFTARVREEFMVGRRLSL
jgi:hypothetical protein